jgi:uncharacterized repeat protein (TIGR01451 family)
VAALTPAGSLIFSQAKASYFDVATGIATEATSNSVVLSVQQVSGVAIELASNLQSPPGQLVQFPHRIVNAGNGTDTFLLSLSVSGMFTPLTFAIFEDPNGNGRVDPGEETKSTSLTRMEPDESRAIVIAAEISASVQMGQTATFLMTAHSLRDPAKSASITDLVEIHNDAQVQSYLSATPTGQVASGESIQYTLTATNKGIREANPVVTSVLLRSNGGVGGISTDISGVLVIHPLPANTLFEEAAIRAPQEALLVYKIRGQWMDSFDPQDKDLVKGVGAILLANRGSLLPAQMAILTMKVRVLAQVTQATLVSEGLVVYRDNSLADRIMEASNSVAHLLIGSAESVYFTDENGNNTTFYHSSQTIYFAVTASSMNQDAATIEMGGVVVVTSLVSGDKESINVIETGENTGIFRGMIVSELIPPVTLGKPVWRAYSRNKAEGDLSSQRGKPVAAVEDGVLDIPKNSSLRLTYINPLKKNTLQTEVLIDPAGVVFNSIANTPLSGIRVTLVDEIGGVVSIPGGGANPVTTGADGHFSFSVPAGQYRLVVEGLPAGFLFPSVLLPHNLTAVGREIDPLGSYGKTFTVTTAVPFDLPVDPPNQPLFVEKLANKGDVAIGDQITYTIQVKNPSTLLPISGIRLLDQLPAGILYKPGSIRCVSTGTVSGPIADPTSSGPMVFHPTCTAPIPNHLAAGEEMMLTYKAIVGPGALMGDGINHVNATGMSVLGATGSNSASAKVNIIQTVFNNRAILMGKVYIDLNNNGEQNDGEPGVPAVRLILEDGTSATTDEAGKYSLYGLEPITHVLKVDPLSLPPDFILSDSATRFAGDPRSRFIDLMEGELHKANFTIAPLPRAIWEPIIRERKEQVGQGAELILGVKSTTPASGPSRGGNAPPAEGIKGKDPNRGADRSAPTVAVTPKSPSATGVPTAGGVPPAVGVPTRDLEALVAAASPKLAMISPTHRAILPIQSTNIVITGHSDMDYKLYINNNPVADDQVGTIVLSKEKPVAAVEWVAVGVKVGENVIKVEGYDPFGNKRETASLTVFVPGSPARLDVMADPRVLPADGVSTSTITVQIWDAASLPVLTRTYLTVTTTQGRLVGEDLDPDRLGLQMAIEGGKGVLQLIAAEQTEDGIITAQLEGSSATPFPSDDFFGTDKNKEEGRVAVSFMPALRKMVAVGILDSAVNLRNFKGKINPIALDDRFDESITQDGRTALYLKGKVPGSALLTLSYDSDKQEGERLFRDIEPEEFYPIYGDSSVRGFDAQSTGKLYVKIEKDKSYLLWGDFSPGFTDNELLAYQRSLSGLKYHFEDEQSAFTAFHNTSQQRQIVDRIPANGTSGFYPLTRVPIVVNSDIIEIVTVDREHPELVIHTEQKTRFVDYTIDANNGKVLFKSPVSSFDKNLNPIFIKVTYETEGKGIAFDTYGVDGKIKLFDRIQIGGTFIQSDDPQNPLTLHGGNLRIKLFEGVIAAGEFAASDGILNGAPADGTGGKVSLSIKPHKKVQANTYWLKTDPEFHNPSANIAGGKIESGLLVHYMAWEGTVFGVETTDSRDEKTGSRRSATDMKIEQSFGTAKGEVGLKHIEDRVPASQTEPQQDLVTDTARAKWMAPFPGLPRLTTSAEYEWALNREADIATLGSDFELNATTKLYGKQEWISGGATSAGGCDLCGGSDPGRTGIGRKGRRSISVIGIDSSAMKGTTAFSEYRIADSISGREGEAAVGLRHQYKIKSGVTLSSTFEQTKIISGPGDDSVAISGGVEHLAHPTLKGSTRLEVRDAAALTSKLWTGAVAYKATPGVSLLARETFFMEDEKGGAMDRWSSRLLLGAALRPVINDRVNLLSRYDFKYESAGLARSQVHVGSVESSIGVNSRTHLFLKYANRITQDSADDAFRSTTQMIESRVTYDLTPKIDLGIEGRHLWQNGLKTQLWGYGVEGGYRLATNLWLSVGYQINGIDQDRFAEGEGVVSGLYIRLRYKFDEGIIDFLRGRPLTLKGVRPLRDEKPVPQIVRPMPPLPVLIPGRAPLPPPAQKIPVPIEIPTPEPPVSYEPEEVPSLPAGVTIEEVKPEVSFSLTETHFNFAKWSLTAKGRQKVAAYASFLKNNPDLSIGIEGHTDRRGSRRYNRRLGMRRAKAVLDALKKAGVTNAMGIVSYGEEKPIDSGRNKKAYQKNRRVEIRAGLSKEVRP